MERTVLVDAEVRTSAVITTSGRTTRRNKNLAHIRTYNEHPDLLQLPLNTQVFGREIIRVQCGS